MNMKGEPGLMAVTLASGYRRVGPLACWPAGQLTCQTPGSAGDPI